jgi:hypothetical protein
VGSELPPAAPLTDEDLQPAFGEALRRAVSEPAVPLEALEPAVRQVGPGIYSLELLRPTAAEALLAQIDRRRARTQGLGAPNSMHEHGLELTPLGFGVLLDELLARWVAPLAARLLPGFGTRLDCHHGYLVEYGRGLDEDLGFHVDDSEVTLNLCLGESFEGAELTLLGARCWTHRDSRLLPGEEIEFEHRPGLAVLHAGAHRHRVEPIRSGRRRNLILWCRDSGLPRPAEHAPGPWCPACPGE